MTTETLVNQTGLPPDSPEFKSCCLLSELRVPSRFCLSILEEPGYIQQFLSSPIETLKNIGFQRRDEERTRPISAIMDRVAEQIDRGKRSGIFVLTPNQGLPSALRTLPNAPCWMFIKGSYLPQDAIAVSIVGPRASTSYGRDVTRKLVEVLTPFCTIVSGMALGIDTTAHETALERGGRTLGVAGCGLDVDYPQGNEGVRKRIPSQGAMLSLYPPGTPANRQNFPERNGIIAGLCPLTIVVEASVKSGALITARLAAEYGREVAAVPGDITRPNSEGANQLLLEGAIPIVRPGDALLLMEKHFLAYQKQSPTSDETAKSTLLPEMNNTQTLIYERIRHEAVSYDALQMEMVPEHMGIGVFTTSLLELEMMGLVKSGPGRVYQAKLR